VSSELAADATCKATFREFANERLLRFLKVDLLVALNAQSDQVLLRIIPKQTARSKMVELEFSQTPALLTTPSVSPEHLLA